ncbi:hypothetical protein Gdia_2470 [Gluconacetobacter diazotrophicus PA1 5]|nr:hypothetical protein Gdia_2470 [Gluconacetobacter diazotrophicus PA1 5]
MGDAPDDPPSDYEPGWSDSLDHPAFARSAITNTMATREAPPPVEEFEEERR